MKIIDKYFNKRPIIFNINVIKRQTKKQIKPFKDMNTIEKLKKLRDENPALAEAIEIQFPEIIDTNPFITNNVLFMRRNNNSNIYQLNLGNNGLFRIKNVRYNKFWGGTIRPTKNESTIISMAYLSKNDFKILLKDSAVKIDTILIIESKHLNDLYTSLTL